MERLEILSDLKMKLSKIIQEFDITIKSATIRTSPVYSWPWSRSASASGGVCNVCNCIEQSMAADQCYQ